MELLGDRRIATMMVTKEDFAATGAGVPATENLVNVPLQIATVEASALFVEPPEGGPIRVSLRSKGKLDCAAFAQQFAGGGHARAAGMKLAGTLAEVKTKVVGSLQLQLSTL